MIWRIRLSDAAAKQLSKLVKPIADRIRAFLHDRLAVLNDPRSIGKALKGGVLGEFWRYRVGDWRLICEIKDEQILITVLSLGNRRDVYR